VIEKEIQKMNGQKIPEAITPSEAVMSTTRDTVIDKRQHST